VYRRAQCRRCGYADRHSGRIDTGVPWTKKSRNALSGGDFQDLWIYATDVAKYTLLVSFAEFFDQISGGDGRFRRPL